jgi:hypothetical protein
VRPNAHFHSEGVPALGANESPKQQAEHPSDVFLGGNPTFVAQLLPALARNASEMQQRRQRVHGAQGLAKAGPHRHLQAFREALAEQGKTRRMNELIELARKTGDGPPR